MNTTLSVLGGAKYYRTRVADDDGLRLNLTVVVKKGRRVTFRSLPNDTWESKETSI